MQHDESFIHIIPLATEHLHAPHISDTLLRLIIDEKKVWKKVVIFYNRRGHSRAYICEDCGAYEKCRHCDIALAYHSDKKGSLICHQCNTKSHVPLICPQCGGARFASVWVGIQRIETELRDVLGEGFRIQRIDSDTGGKTPEILALVEESDIILATNRAFFLTHPSIGAFVYLLFEINLSIPEYDIEEITALELSQLKRRKIPLYIQTYTPDHPLLDMLMFGNQKSLIASIQEERKAFLYPPYSELATLRIHDENKDRVSKMIAQLMNKLSLLKRETTRIVHDTEIWEKSRGEWVQKIILRDRDLSYLIGEFEVEIVRNRSITLEWH